MVADTYNPRTGELERQGYQGQLEREKERERDKERDREREGPNYM